MYKSRKIKLLFINSLLLNRNYTRRNIRFIIGVSALFFSLWSKAQTANYVNNGSFEDYYVWSIYPIPYYWGATDSMKPFGELLVAPNKVPLNSYAYQWPKHGKNYLIGLQFCSTCPVNKRLYPRNRLKTTLVAGHTYCFKMFVSLANEATHATDAIQVYFSDGSLDTIKKCNDAITYLPPQIVNTPGNVITDTLNWVPITGTFVANGTEKYLLIGNFKSDANTNTVLTNTTHLPANFSDYLIDAVSVIEVDLPAHAGPDVSTAPGHSVYIGRELDFATDPGCVWFKLPEMTPIDTASGTWVQPTVTTTYVVRQILDCSSEKWDTVVVHMDLVGLGKIDLLNQQVRIYPVPARDYIELSSLDRTLLRDITTAEVYNNLGQKLREETFSDERFRIKIEDLPPGSYSLYIKNQDGLGFNKRFVVAP